MSEKKKRFSSFFMGSALGQSLALLGKGDKRKVYLVCLIQTFLGFLDLAAVAIFGVLGAIAISGLESNQPGAKVQTVLRILNIDHLEFQTQAALLAIFAITLLVGKTIFSMYITKRTLYFLSYRSAKLSSTTFSKLLSAPLLFIQKRNSQETLYALTTGISTLTLGVIGSLVLLISDTSLLLVMTVALLFLDPFLAMMTIVMFSGIALFIFILLNKRARELGVKNSQLAISGNTLIIEFLSTFREQTVRNRQYFYSDKIRNNRTQFSNVAAETSFMPYISKYILETTVIIGCIAIAAFQFYRHDAYQAVATLSIFIAAAMRIAPAILRIQQSAIQIRVDSATAENTRILLNELNDYSGLFEVTPPNDFDHEGFVATVVLEDVNFTYPNSHRSAVQSVSLEINSGQVVAIVGPSGSGKSTLVDLILGVLKPDTGSIEISGCSPAAAIAKFPGACAYVPQDVFLIDGSISENISIGYEESQVSHERINAAIQIAQLEALVNSLPGRLSAQVGERGSKLSGGQKQRLGVARSLYTNPKLLVLDEATSALDGQTEADFSEAISAMKGNVTVILIAHRLSTVRKADLVVYIDEGKIQSLGTFEQVRKEVTNFDTQAALMGL